MEDRADAADTSEATKDPAHAETSAPAAPPAAGQKASEQTVQPPVAGQKQASRKERVKSGVLLALHFLAAVAVVFLGFMLAGFVATIVGGALGFDTDRLVAMLQVGVPLETDAAPTSMTAALMSTPMYLVFLGTWAVGLLWMLPRFNRPVLLTLGTATRGNTADKLLLGIALGFAMNGVCVLVAVLTGRLGLSYLGLNLTGAALLFVSVFIQSAAEEFVCRCYLYQRILRSGSRPMVAILACSLFFSALHLGNPGITVLALVNIFLVGVFFGLLVYRLNSPWAAMGAHAGWNFTQNILFGLPNSGSTIPFSIFGIDGSPLGGFTYDPVFGVEGTAMASLVLVVGIAALLAYGRRKPAPPTAWELAEARAAR